MSLACPACGHANVPESRFCNQCGRRLAGSSAGETAERRQMTVMFSDLVGSTSLSERLDPEDLRHVVRAYQAVCGSAVARFEGHVAQYLGDGMLIYFGYPVAHEDDPERAVRTALVILADLRSLSQRLERELGARAEARIGIHTGLVVVGSVGMGDRHEQLALGETPNVAARLQGLAAPGTVVISGTTRLLLRAGFELQNLGVRPVKGLSAGVQVFAVVAETSAETELRTGLPFVGRDEEYRVLLDHWRTAAAGHPQFVILDGEPGIGKSRLLARLKEHVTDEGARALEARCSPYHQDAPLYPLVELLQRVLEWTPTDVPGERLAKLETALGQHGLTSALPGIAFLLSIPTRGERPSPLTPEQQRRTTLNNITTWLAAMAADAPMLLAIEDAHWADPSTVEFLALLFERVAGARLLAIVLARPDFRPCWPLRSDPIRLTLNRLSIGEAETLVKHAAGQEALPPPILTELLSRTDGVPLFIEEMTKTVVQAGAVPSRTGDGVRLMPSVPATLRDSLMARLDRLGNAKRVAQMAAVFGREFSPDLLEALGGADADTLRRDLQALVEAGLLYVGDSPHRVTYVFKHALIQDIAYESLLRSTRRDYHARIAEVLEQRSPEVVDTQPELLAHHYTAAGIAATAVSYWQRAGRRALERSAHVEAVRHVTRGLDLLAEVSDRHGRLQRELQLHQTLGPALIASQGWAAPTVGETYNRALSLCDQLNVGIDRVPVVFGLWVFHHVRAEHHRAVELGRQLVSLAKAVADRDLLIEASLALGDSLFWIGELREAREHLERSVDRYDRSRDGAHAVTYGQDPFVVCHSYLGWIAWLRGTPDLALEHAAAAMARADELSQPFSQAFAQYTAAWVHKFRGEWARMATALDAVNAQSIEHGFPHWRAAARLMRGWLTAREGDPAVGIEEMRSGLEAYAGTGSAVLRGYYLGLLAEAYGRAGETAEALGYLDQALVFVAATGERFYEAELYRLKAEVLRSNGAPDVRAIEACLAHAIATARAAGAKALELRGLTTLVRFRRDHGRYPDALDTLREVYASFLEGFGTADLLEARALIGALA